MAIEQAERSGVTLDQETVEAFRANLRGELLVDGDEGYDVARRVWNGMIDKYPAMIARCTGTADVVAAVNFARAHEIEIAIRGGGHNVAGSAVNDNGLVIDLSLMKGAQVDPVRKVARVQAGATWGDLDRETQLHGLLTPGGQVSTTGVAGFTLAGGMAITRRKWGLACDNLIAAEVVTADGNVVFANDRQNSDLLWGLRGGGGNFGVVTSFEFQLHELGPDFAFVGVMYPMKHARKITRAWNEFFLNAPDEVTVDIACWNVLPVPDIDPELVGQPVVLILAGYAGPSEEGARVLRPLREFEEPLVDMSDIWSYAELWSAFDFLFPNTQRYYWKSLSFQDLTNDVIDAMIELATQKPTAATPLALRGLGGAMGRIPEDATAYREPGCALQPEHRHDLGRSGRR